MTILRSLQLHDGNQNEFPINFNSHVTLSAESVAVNIGILEIRYTVRLRKTYKCDKKQPKSVMSV